METENFRPYLSSNQQKLGHQITVCHMSTKVLVVNSKTFLIDLITGQNHFLLKVKALTTTPKPNSPHTNLEVTRSIDGLLIPMDKEFLYKVKGRRC